MSLNGIDISSRQAGIDLSAVPADFVICKATQGTWYVSPDCDRQFQQAKAAGRRLGVYHYAEGGNYKAEADFFLRNVEGYIREAILCLDWEAADNPTFDSGRDRAWIKGFCDYVTEKTGIRPLIYISRIYMAFAQGVGDYGLWIAQYENADATGYQETPWNEGAYFCAIRQYSDHGRLPGYEGDLDLDKFYGDREAWDKYAGGGDAALPSEPDDITREELLMLVADTMRGLYGNGDERREKLGLLYNDVQGVINHISEAPVDTLVRETLQGKYGNGQIRKTVLGRRYAQVQDRINNAR